MQMFLKFLNWSIIYIVFNIFFDILTATFSNWFEFSLIYFNVHIGWKSLWAHETIMHIWKIIRLVLYFFFLHLHGFSQIQIWILLCWSIFINFWLFEFNIQYFLYWLSDKFIIIYNWYLACCFLFHWFLNF